MSGREGVACRTLDGGGAVEGVGGVSLGRTGDKAWQVKCA